jgi:hypothetical protein
MTLEELQTVLHVAPEGSRAIIFGIRDPRVSQVGHFFNAASQKGGERLLDGQIGGAANPSLFDRFRLMWTTP